MKKKVIRISGLVLTLGLLSSFLLACEQRSGFRFLNQGGEGYWGEDYYYDDYDDYYEEYSKNNKNSSSNNGGGQRSSSNNNGGNSNTDELTFDENSTKFSHSFSGTGAGEVAIQVNSDNCKDDELVIPSTYVDSKGNKYKVTMDYGNGFGYLSAQKITLPDGFKEIHEGFDMCMYVKRIYLPKTITKLYNEILTSCVSLKTIDFAGTKAQWNAIEKEERWNFNAPAFDVSCSDGIINIEKGPTA